MPTPKSGYYNVKGDRVPGTTTIISRFKDSGALIHWSNQLAVVPYRQVRAWMESVVSLGVLSPGLISDAKALLAVPPDACDYRKARDTAAGIGTVVHVRVDCHIRGHAFDPAPFITTEMPDPVAASQLGFDAFLQWAGSTNFKLIEGEIQLVSNQYNYGGTPDVCLVRGRQELGDWKSGDLYAEQVLPQLAAYRQLLVENGGAVGDGAHAISINKKTGGFTHRYFTPDEVAKGWQAFELMNRLYHLVKELK